MPLVSSDVPIRTSLDHKNGIIKRLDSSDNVTSEKPGQRTHSRTSLRSSGLSQLRGMEGDQPPNGYLTKRTSGDGETLRGTGLPLANKIPPIRGMRPSHGPTPDGERSQAVPSTSDQGFFAGAPSVEIEEGLWSTKVKLDANSVMDQPRDSSQSLDKTRMSETPFDRDVASEREPRSREPSLRADGLFANHTQPHRISSPPTFQSSQHGETIRPQPPGKLQHRHTLEVPRLASGRTSRDGASLLDDTAIATGRNTPSSPARRRGSTTLVRRNTRSIHSDSYLDDVPQDDEAARWAEAIRRRRASKRSRREDDDDDRVVMGTKVDQTHVNYTMAYNMLTGIRFTVSRTNAKLFRDLTDTDFTTSQKFSFDVTGNELTPSVKYDFKFKDYAPLVFRHLRSMFRLDPGDYLMSLTSKYILSELGSPGKSGSFFYFSRDYKYIIKTIHHAEHKFLRKILKDYYYHVQQNPNTLLSQFYGLHRVKAAWSGKKIHFVVMNNLFPAHRDIHRTFDLKGSTIGRDFHEEDLESNPRATLKDLNWLRRNLHLEFGPIKRQFFIKQMQQDVHFLQRNKIMDYSLLVGIHDLERGNKDDLRNKTLQVFQPGGEEDPALLNALKRTPSKLESAKKAKDLRMTLRNERPVPLEMTTSKMPDEMEADRKGFYFYRDDGGFQATHEDNMPGEEIYYLGIIDCLTRYSVVKRLEHFFKGLAAEKSQISAIPPDPYGDRFVKFISGTTKTREEAEKENRVTGSVEDPSLSNTMQLGHLPTPGEPIIRNTTTHSNPVIRKAEAEAERSRRHGANEIQVPNRQLLSVRSPSAERGEGGGFTLPVVEEAAESQSLGGRSGQSQDPPRLSPSPSPTILHDAEVVDSPTEIGRPPPTPPKDAQYRGDMLLPLSARPLSEASIRSQTQTQHKDGERGPPTPPKDRVKPKDVLAGGRTTPTVDGLIRPVR